MLRVCYRIISKFSRHVLKRKKPGPFVAGVPAQAGKATRRLRRLFTWLAVHIGVCCDDFTGEGL